MDIAHELEIEQDKLNPEDRITQLEEAADINPEEAREIACEVVTELMQNNEIPDRFHEQPTEYKTAI